MVAPIRFLVVTACALAAMTGLAASSAHAHFALKGGKHCKPVSHKPGTDYASSAIKVVNIGCKNDGVSDAELDRQRADAAQNARQETEIKALRRDLKREGAGGSISSAPARSPAPDQIPSGAQYCDSAYAAGSASCPFAENVGADYYASGRSASFSSYSPVTDRVYAVTCNGASPTVCTAGNNAIVYIP